MATTSGRSNVTLDNIAQRDPDEPMERRDVLHLGCFFGIARS